MLYRFKEFRKYSPQTSNFLRGSSAHRKDIFVAKLGNINLLSSLIGYGKNFQKYYVSGFNGDVFAFGSVGLRFKSPPGQIRHCARYCCDIFLKEALCYHGAMTHAEMDPANS